ncbi:MAG: HesA/MoeB/ThiF family protein [Methylocystaceae bacterium]
MNQDVLRYSRNQEAITLKEQSILKEASVLIIGCGGLGGYVIEELTRIGVGRLTVWDGDKFETSNLNRQLLALDSTLDQGKAPTAAERVKAINPETRVEAIDHFFAGSEADQAIIARHQVVVDALDSISARMALARCCRNAGVMLVHGAVGGWWGQVAVISPGDKTLEAVYPDVSRNKGCEQKVGCLVMSVAAVATLEAAEAVKILLGRPHLPAGQLLIIDLLNSSLQTVEIPAFLDTPGDGQ